MKKILHALLICFICIGTLTANPSLRHLAHALTSAPLSHDQQPLLTMLNRLILLLEQAPHTQRTMMYQYIEEHVNQYLHNPTPEEQDRLLSLLERLRLLATNLMRKPPFHTSRNNKSLLPQEGQEQGFHVSNKTHTLVTSIVLGSAIAASIFLIMQSIASNAKARKMLGKTKGKKAKMGNAKQNKLKKLLETVEGNVTYLEENLA
mgnify:CR=1 FL=1